MKHAPKHALKHLRSFLFLLPLLLAACQGTEQVALVEEPVEPLYNRASDDLASGRYLRAAALFSEVERQHPYSEWATRAQLMAAYSHYQILQYDETITALDRFIDLHPGHRNIDYAYYLRAISYYEQISDIRRDQGITQLALDALSNVILRFPESVYAQDARIKLDLTRDHLAAKSMEIGRYYLEQQQYHAAVNRFRTVVETYQTTTHVPEALHRLTECYLALGLVDEALKSAAVLGHNYPGSRWYEDSFRLVGGEGLPVAEAEESLWEKFL